jgi:3-oxoacyl-[acyl-carrier-protein] synthase III
MATGPEEVGIHSFACALGDVEFKPETIPDFDDLWQTVSFGAEFSDMGNATIRKMSAPPADYVIETVGMTLQHAGVSAGDIDHIVFATSEPALAALPEEFAAEVLTALGLVSCVPHLVSFQRCCSSLTALRYARQVLSDPGMTHALLVTLDFTPLDRDRVRPYAIFGDAAASCLLTKGDPGLIRLITSEVQVDLGGMRGRDTFESRKKLADRTLSAVFGASGRQLEQVSKVFAANLHKPLTLFNAASVGLLPDTVHFTDTLSAYGHCGNSDWLINLIDYHQRFGIRAGETYLAQSLAPGFYACAVLEGSLPRGAETTVAGATLEPIAELEEA